MGNGKRETEKKEPQNNNGEGGDKGWNRTEPNRNEPKGIDGSGGGGGMTLSGVVSGETIKNDDHEHLPIFPSHQNRENPNKEKPGDSHLY
jgi:hypothetical protein